MQYSKYRYCCSFYFTTRNFNSICRPVYLLLFLLVLAWPGLAWPGLCRGCNNLLLSNELINHQETQSTRTKLTQKFDHHLNFKYILTNSTILLPVLEPIIDGHIQKCWSFTLAIIQMPSFKLNTRAEEEDQPILQPGQTN